MAGMKTIARAGGVNICIRDGWTASFFASPYHAHRQFSAVDIYQCRDYGEKALSPVSGVVRKIMMFDSPTPNEKNLPEYLILVKSGRCTARLMHVKPSVGEGDALSAGDVLGTFIKNGFFTYWVDACVHAEIRENTDMLRASGGLELEPLIDATVPEKPNTGPLKGTVSASCERNVTVRLDRRPVASVGGLPAIPDGTLCLDYAGLIGGFPPGERVFFNGIPIGTIRKSSTSLSIFETEPLETRVNGVRFKGLSFACNTLDVKLLPERYGKTTFCEGGEVEITMRNIKK
ncbi:MAG: hypothetical protein JW724_06390 [Candidatus Altiarchaeota archaeon]|nr:hypothetical protein [Candidatus Altiarchaeota archaeon]